MNIYLGIGDPFFYHSLGKVDQESLRGFLKELSSEPHIAAGRRDK